MRVLCMVLAALLVCTTGSAQSATKIKPRWIDSTPHSRNDGYYFVTLHTDTSSSIDACRTAVLKELATNVERTDKVSVSELYSDSSQQQYRNGRVTTSGSDSYELKLSVEGTARAICSRRIDEFLGKDRFSGRNCYYALYAVERFGSAADFSDIRVTSKYGARGLWRSAIIPGWGQFHKHNYLKGGLILGGCAIFTGGIIFTENERNNYAAKIGQTHDINAIKIYQNRRNHFAIARNVCIGAAAALYIYNLVDAVVAPGARRVAVKKVESARVRNYAVAPTISACGDPQLFASITF